MYLPHGDTSRWNHQGTKSKNMNNYRKKKKNTVAVDEKHRYDTQDTDTTIKIYVLV